MIFWLLFSSDMPKCAFFYLAIIPVILCNCETLVEPSACKEVCALRTESTRVEFHTQDYLPLSPLHIPTGERRCEERFKKWTGPATRLLGLLTGSAIASNVTTSDCPFVHDSLDTRLAQRSIPYTKFDGSFRPLPLVFFTRTSSATQCRLHFNHYIARKSESGRLDFLWIKANKTQNNGTLIALISATSGLPVLVNPGNESRTCSNSSCDSYAMLWRGHEMFNNSLFVDFDDIEVPGLRSMLSISELNAERIGNIQSDLSASNLAIVVLPLVMSIPPISLLENVSHLATIWYVIATDILAALPLLIKGIELLIEVNSRNLVKRTAFSIGTENGRIFENFYLRCRYNGIVNGFIASLLTFVALWFMVASIYVEFVFWRSRHSAVARRRRDFVKDEDPYPSDKQSIGLPAVTMTWTEKMRTSFWDGKRKVVSSLIIGLTVSNIFHFAVSWEQKTFERYSWLPFSVILVASHLVLSREIAGKFLPELYLLGFAFGLVGGPVYLGLHAFGIVRTSVTWLKISAGANAGFAYLPLALLSALWSARSEFFVAFPGLFTWFYGLSFILLNAIRSTRDERKYWKFYSMGGGLGVLFGPAGFLFVRIFPENRKDKISSAKLNLGCAYGAICWWASLFPVGYSLYLLR